MLSSHFQLQKCTKRVNPENAERWFWMWNMTRLFVQLVCRIWLPVIKSTVNDFHTLGLEI